MSEDYINIDRVFERISASETWKSLITAVNKVWTFSLLAILFAATFVASALVAWLLFSSANMVWEMLGLPKLTVFIIIVTGCAAWIFLRMIESAMTRGVLAAMIQAQERRESFISAEAQELSNIQDTLVSILTILKQRGT